MSVHHEHPEGVRDAPPISAMAFAELYASNFLQVKAFLARQDCIASSLDDLAQEVFLRAWEGRSRFLGRASFRTWLFAIALNVAREWRRQRSPAQLLDRDPWEEDVAGQLAEKLENAKDVRTAVSLLPPNQQMAIKIVYFEGLKPVEAAAKANCGQKAFHQRLVDARIQLRRRLINREGD